MTITYSKQAEAFLANQIDKLSNRVVDAICALPAGDVQKFRSIKHGFRLRIGTIRVLFERTSNSIHVIDIGYRGDIY